MVMTDPQASEEKSAWQPTICRHALTSRVLVVARTRIEGVWAAYADAVPGINHDKEWQNVLDMGDKVSEQIARSLFPQFADVPYAP